MTWHTFFDRIYIINLDNRTDRWKKIQAQLHHMNITNYERFSAIRPTMSDIPLIWKKNYNLTRIPPSKQKKYIIGATGCKLSHYHIIKKASEHQYQSILILEDDSIFRYQSQEMDALFQQSINDLPSDWWMLYLGGKNIKSKPHSSHLHRTLGIKTTHAYGMSKNLYKQALLTMLGSGKEIDLFYLQIHRQFPCFRVVPGLITQDDDFSDIQQKKVAYRTIT